jgi:hypothetical protein
MKPIRVFSLIVGLCAMTMLAIGCAKGNNPVAVDNASPAFGWQASLVPTGSKDTIGVDTGVVNQNYIFRILVLSGRADSVFGCSWNFGDGSALQNWTGLQNGQHRFTAPGKYYVELSVRMLNGDIKPCGKYLVVVSPGQIVTTPTKDSVFLQVSKTPVGVGTDVWSVTFGSLVSALVPKTGTANPFTEGYDDWSAPILMGLQPKSANNRLFLVTKQLAAGAIYDVGLGKLWKGTDTASTWLTKSEQAGNRLYNVRKNIMSFYLGYNGTAYPIDSIPADSGRGNVVVPPVVVDTTHPYVYGDAKDTHWRVGFTDIIHSLNGGKDSVIVFCSLHGLEACSTSVAVMTTKIPTLPSINLTVPAGKLYGYAVIALADIPNDIGLVWNYYRGACSQTDNSSSSYWSYTENSVITNFQATIVNYGAALSKRAAGPSHLLQLK